MKSADDIAAQIVPIGLDIREGPSWLREDVADVLRPLLAVLERAVYDQRGGDRVKCRICGWTWWSGHEPDHAHDCPVPAAQDV